MSDQIRETTADGYEEARRIGAILRALRSQRGMTLDEVAERAGLSKSRVWEMEKDKGRDVTVRAVRALARCFGVSVVTFLADSDLGPNLHPEALRIAIQVDDALRKASAA